MRLNIRTKHLSFALFNAALTFGFLLFAMFGSSSNSPRQAVGDQVTPLSTNTYDIVLNQDNQIDWTPKTVLTSSGNTVGVDYYLPKAISNGFVGINHGGWFKNTTPITGIKSMAINIGSGTLLLSYGYTLTTYAMENVVIGPTTHTYDFPHEPQYIRLSNASGTTVNIYTLTLTYSYEFVDQTIGTSGLSFTLNGDGKSYSVAKGSISTAKTSLTIPPVYQNRFVTTISSSGFSGLNSLVSDVLPDTNTVLGFGSFMNCSQLVNITLPVNLTSLGAQAFYGCSQLQSIVVPRSVTSIGNTAFANLYDPRRYHHSH